VNFGEVTGVSYGRRHYALRKMTIQNGRVFLRSGPLLKSAVAAVLLAYRLRGGLR